MEVSVVPKTSASTDSPWLGLAKYAWSGWVLQLRALCSVVSMLPGALDFQYLTEVTPLSLLQVRDWVPQLWGGVSQPTVLVWQSRSCEHCSENRNWACLARGKSGYWIVFVYVCSYEHVYVDSSGHWWRKWIGFHSSWFLLCNLVIFWLSWNS